MIDSQEKPHPTTHAQNRTKSAREGGSLFAAMHWLHWVILLASLLLTFTAWKISSRQISEKAANTYERETAKIIELVLERMQRYEDALWAGAAHINSTEGDIEFSRWKEYAERIGIERKYPGINGLGVIHHVTKEELGPYLDRQRVERPDYRIHPDHDESEYWPISYIIPVTGNRKAVGLDMAHESNRYTAAKQARDTGEAVITGPIVLVQDELQTSGFLFFVPFYGGEAKPVVEEDRRREIKGLVYAAFVVRNLVYGVLSRDLRNISFSIEDAGTPIFSENSQSEVEYDPNPLFESSETIDIYGRKWKFSFRSSHEFRRELNTAQPTTILIGGITVDLLLLGLFLLISRNSRRNEQQAQRLLIAQKRIEQANEELSHFNYRTSHDLVAPLKTIRGCVNLAKQDLKEEDFDNVSECLGRIEGQAHRLESLVKDLLKLCRVDNEDGKAEEIDAERLFDLVRSTLEGLWTEKKVELRFSNQLTEPFSSEPIRIRQILENLVSNGVKYSDPQKPTRWVKVTFSKMHPDWIRLEVSDNGIGIPGTDKSKVYEMFYRAGNNSEFGSGLGNYLVKKHVSHLGAKIDYRSSPEGTIFQVDIPTSN